MSTSPSTIVCTLDDAGWERIAIRDVPDTGGDTSSRRSRICIGAPCTFNVPGTVVSVVKSIAETSECVPVSFDMSVD